VFTYNGAGLFTVRHRSTNAHDNYWTNKTNYINVTIAADTTPPPSITGLTGTVDSCSQITWNWNNPGGDYALLMVYRNGAFLHNVTSPTAVDVWNSLTESSSYQFAGRTVDTTGNLNTTWVNVTQSTTACYVPNPPVSDFTANTTTACAGDTIAFTDTSTGGAATSWIWDVNGDGASESTLQNVNAQYASPGTFSVNHKATNADGSSWMNKTDYITVTSCTPTAAFSANKTTVCADEPILFTDASTGTGISTHNWYFWSNESLSSTSTNPVTSFNLTGTYSIRLFVSSPYGNDFENKTGYITVNDCAPDTIAPPSVTLLSGASYDCGRITWIWTDPVAYDLAGIQLWLNGTYAGNVSPGVQTKLTTHTLTGVYELGTRTFDISGNMNTSWVNATSNTTACAASGTGVAVVGNEDNSMSIIALIGSVIAGLVAIGARSLWT
jgi:PKD repeat protein